MSDYKLAPDEARDAYINESTSFPGGAFDVDDNLGPSIVEKSAPNDSEHEPCRSEIEGNWEQIEAQLSYWQDMDNQYWIQRKEKEYRAYLDRKVQGFFQQIDSDLKEANENPNNPRN